MMILHHRNNLSRLYVFEIEGHQALLSILSQSHKRPPHDAHPVIKSVLAETAGNFEDYTPEEGKNGIRPG